MPGNGLKKMVYRSSLGDAWDARIGGTGGRRTLEGCKVCSSFSREHARTYERQDAKSRRDEELALRSPARSQLGTEIRKCFARNLLK